MSLVPILMLLVSLIRFLPFDQADVLRIFSGAVPESVYRVISPIVGSIYRSGGGVITVSILLTLFSASGAMRAIMKGLDAVYEVERRENVIVFFARAVVYMLILTLSFLLLYRWVPAGEHHTAFQWPGAVFCAVAWAVFSWVFSIYISISDKFGAYGYIGTIMVAMMWMYYCFQFLLIGGCINAVIEARSDTRGTRQDTRERPEP